MKSEKPQFTLFDAAAHRPHAGVKSDIRTQAQRYYGSVRVRMSALTPLNPYALQAAGWQVPAAPPPTAEPARTQQNRKADLALQQQLFGTYYVETTNAVSPEIVLAKDGRFSYKFQYMNVDQFSAGTWKVSNQKVIFRSRANTPPVPYTLRARATVDQSSSAADVTVQVMHENQQIQQVYVTLIGEKPVRVKGAIERGPWSAPLVGPLKHIVLFHPDINERRPFVYDVTDETRTFIFDTTKHEPRFEEFNYTMALRGGRLVWTGDDREIIYKKVVLGKGPFRQ